MDSVRNRVPGRYGMLCVLLCLAAASAAEERSLSELRSDMDAGRTSAAALVRSYLQRIEQLDRNGPKLHAVLALNPDAMRQARELDRELRMKGARGPLHGIPILLKDNIESADPLPTTAGSLALADNVTGRDAPVVANLRAAGAIVLGKTNLSEWANFRSEQSLSGWSALGGLTRNPHVLDRSACGSSSGSAVAVAAGLAAASVGTETDGSITCPAAMNGVVGLKPTLGLLSAKHIIPIAHSQDSAGPIAASVADVAIMLGAMVGDKPACDPAATGCKKLDYLAALAPTALQGKRIGVQRFAAGRHPRIEPLYENALDHLREAGATLVEVPTPDTARVIAAERIVLNTEFKADLNAYLAATPASVATRDLSQLIEFNRGNARELSLFGQDVLERANATTGLHDPAYLTALVDAKRLAGVEGIDRLLAEYQVELLVAPTTGTAWRIDIANGSRFPGSFSTLPAVAGYPHLTVPMAQLHGLPLGLSFIGPAWSEDLLLAAAYAFELEARVRMVPKFKPSLEAAERALQPTAVK